MSFLTQPLAIAQSLPSPPAQESSNQRDTPALEEEPDEEAEEPDNGDFEEEMEEELDDFDDEEFEEESDDGFSENPNPLDRSSNELDKLIQRRFNEDTWQDMLGDLPCAEATNDCIRQLQNEAIFNSLTLGEIDTRIEETNERIDEARSRNKRSVFFDTLSPALQYYLASDGTFSEVDRETRTVTEQEQFIDTRLVEVIDEETGERSFEEQQFINTRLVRRDVEEERPPGALQRIISDVLNPSNLVNNLLTLVGVPLIQGIFGGNDAAQRRAIAIGDLQIRVAEMQRGRAEIAQAIREKVQLMVLDLDTEIREFQISQEIAIRDQQRLRIIEINYRFGEGNTESYLSQLSALDGKKAATLRAWTAMRSKLELLKLLVLSEDF